MSLTLDALHAKRRAISDELRADAHERGQRLQQLLSSCDPSPQGSAQPAGHSLATERPRIAPGNGTDAGRANLDLGTAVPEVEHAARLSSRAVASRHPDADPGTGMPAGVRDEATLVAGAIR